jgi:integrase
MTRRAYGIGSLDARGKNSWRLRYRIEGKSFTKTVQGNKTEAQRALRQLLQAGDIGEHVGPDKITLGQWVEHWISIGCPGNKRRREPGERAKERYAQLLRFHVLPALGERPLQQLQSTEIDELYTKLLQKVSARTAHSCACRPWCLPRHGHANAEAVTQSHARIGESPGSKGSQSRHST